MSHSSPLVSAIMPTRDRPAFTLKAIESFLSQSWPNKELVIVDDDDAPSLGGFESFANVRYARVGREPLGTIRNLACALCDGEIIVHFDSDDISAPGRMKEQVEFLIESAKQVTVFSSSLWYETREVKVYDNGIWRPTSGWWLANEKGCLGNSLCYTKAWWELHNFPNVQCGEDDMFWNVAVKEGVAQTTLGKDQMVTVNHTGNGSGRICGGHDCIELPEAPNLSWF